MMTRINRKPQRKFTLTFLLVVFLGTGLIAYFVIRDTIKKTIESQAVAFAEIAAVQATTARSVYAKEIADKLRQDGLGPNVDFGHMKGYVPIPAQFLKMLGLASTANTSDLFHYKPVSKWNLEASQGLDDDFLRWAWPQIEQQDISDPIGPIKWNPVWRFEKQGGQKVLRYLSPDAASQSSCVACHNSYENKPEIIDRRKAAHVPAGKQWKQYQLLGAISITIPLKKVEEMAAVRVRDTSILIFGILLASLGLAIGFSRRQARQEINLEEVERDLHRSEKEAHDAKELLLAKQDVEIANEKLHVLLNSNMDDLAVAHIIMSQIMRSEGLNDPQIRYYQRPAQQFSGDIIAVARDEKGGLRIMLADVTGHGLQAALFLLPISRVFYSMVKKGYMTSDIVKEMNKTMKEIAVTGRFIAAVVAHIDRDNSSIEIWNGGVPTAFYVQKNGGLHNFRSQHLPLGVLNAGAFDATTEIYHAQPGALLLCSDGLAEAENVFGEPFGDARLETILQTSLLDKLFDNIQSSLETHLGGATPHDDLSIVLAQCDN
jgi:serine phosphatase RsbU (regulator of sigma subunit)